MGLSIGDRENGANPLIPMLESDAATMLFGNRRRDGEANAKSMMFAALCPRRKGWSVRADPQH